MTSVRQPSAVCKSTRNTAPTPPVKAPTTTDRDATAKRLRRPRVPLFGNVGLSDIGKIKGRLICPERGRLGLRGHELGLVRERCGGHHGLGGIPRGSLSGRVQGHEESDQRGGFGRAEVFPIRGHVPTPLNDLAKQLIAGLHYRYSIERGAALAALPPELMAIVALLELKNERALAFQSGAFLQVLRRNRIATPSVHHRAPRRVTGETR